MKFATRETLLTKGMSEGEKRLWRFCEARRRGLDPAPDDVDVLVAAFRLILKGEDPKKALGIAGKQGRRKLSGAEVGKDLHLSIAVEQLRAAGIPRDKAREKVANDADVPYSEIEYLHRRDRRSALAVIATMRALERDHLQIVNMVQALAARRAKK